MTSSESHSGHFVQANGLDIYYEERGQGRSLILLHGGTLTGDSWQPYLAGFTERYRVFTPDSRGHGRTANPTGSMSYRLLADDIAAFVQALGLQKPLICGFSDGGQVALEIGMRYPTLAQALVVGAAWFSYREAYRESMRELLGDTKSPEVDTERFERENPEWTDELKVSYGTEGWKTFLRQIKPMWASPLNYTPDDFAKVIAPTLVLVGDRDSIVPVEEAAEMYRLLPNAELAIVPGADHISFIGEKAGLFQPLIVDFLERKIDLA